jgi:hypothetical protein
MAHTYTPGLRVTAYTTVRKERRLPIAGNVVVQKGTVLKAEDVVATAELPGNVTTVNVMNLLGIGAKEIPNYMLKKEGDTVTAEEVIAETRPFIKLFRSSAKAPSAGTIEIISDVTGQVIIRAEPRPVDLRAYIDGTVIEVRENEGVTIETSGAFIQGILGVGGEVCGEIVLAGSGRDTVIEPGDLDESMRGKIVVAGAFVSSDVFQRASEIGIAALICGGINDSDLRVLLGRDLGVAITGQEDISPIIIITEGFGRIPMAEATYSLLAAHEGQRASASGATQIRAGVMRPEIIIPTGKPAGPAAAGTEDEAEPAGLQEGTRTRIIREPYFGVLGTVKSLPTGLATVESETKVRVVEITCDDGRTVIVPRSNVEAIET